MRAKTTFSIIAGLALFCPTSRVSSQTTSTGAPVPKLVVVISVDQMRADFLAPQRLGDGGNLEAGLQPLYTKGFKTLLADGTVFSNAQHLHALTETGPGHAVISTGSHPSHHGIVSNDWWDRHLATKVSAVDDPWVESLPSGIAQGKKSPIHLLRPALGDYLKRTRPSAKVVSIAQKDRAAILMGGLRPDLASWFDTESGQWITSRYYRTALPQWLAQFNRSQSNSTAPYAFQYRSATWNRRTTPSVSDYKARSRSDSYSKEARGFPELFPTDAFPHSLAYPYPGVTDPKPYLLVGKSPFGDLVTLEMVKQAIQGEDLGQDDVPDLLWIGFSAPDLLGHLFGPWSQELMDEYLRLDEVVGALIDHLDSEIGRSDYLLVLTADHGAPAIPDFGVQVLSLPAAWQSKGVYEAEVRRRFSLRYPALASALRPADDDILGFSFDLAKLQAGMTSRRDAEEALRGVLLGSDGVQAVYTRTDIISGKPGDPYMGAFVNTFHDGRSPDVLVRFDEHRIVSIYSTGTSHGSPYQYDRHVPLIVFGNGSVARTVTDAVAPVDIAPTLAELLRINSFPTETDSKSFLTRTR